MGGDSNDQDGKKTRRIQIKNKLQRQKLFASIKHEKNKARHQGRKQRAKEEAEDPQLKQERLEAHPQETIESKRVYDETVNVEREGEDEFEAYFREQREPKVLVTTNKKAHREAYEFGQVLLDILPNSNFVQRKQQFEVAKICELCQGRGYTDVVVINEDKKHITGLQFIHLPTGPTLYFSVSSLRYKDRIAGHGNATKHYPELVLNNFSTRLGQQVGRMFQSLFPQQPEFQGRQVVTLHNQRDFIFFRRHRYVFKSDEKVGLQELGPEFTLKLRRVQKGIRGQVQWEHRPDMDRDKRKFYL